jgi:hypothetical protein
MTYTSLEQRMAQNYIDTFPPFVPDETAPVSTSEQERFYLLMKNLYQLAFDEPLLFVASLHEDDAYPTFGTKSSYNKPKLLTDMKKFTKTVDTLLSDMFQAGQNGELKLNQRQKVIISRLGIDDLTSLPAAWVWMAKRPDADFATFSHCFFKRDYPYTSDIYAHLLGDTAFRKLEAWMLSRDYERFDIYDITASDCKLSLTFANRKWSKSIPTGGFEYKIKHTGISAKLEPYIQNPAMIGLCIPNGLKLFLESFGSMDEKLQSFVVDRTRKCDNCRYCVQTDKTGSRPLANIPVAFGDVEHRLCPYFPGYSYRWLSLDDNLVEMLISILSFMDKFIPEQNSQ